jgi:hypothetical protein
MKTEATNTEAELNSRSDNDSQSKLICKKCKAGRMLPAVEEGNPEYTDNFICSNCQHRDTIPTRDLLASQIISALLGVVICLYLLSGQLSKLFQGFQHDTLEKPISTFLLVLVASFFLSGFIYVLFKAQEGLRHRSLYTKNR